MDYNLFRASLITCSTGALASSFKIAVTTFCEGACANPSIVRAATASSCTCALAAVKAGPVMSTAPETNRLSHAGLFLNRFLSPFSASWHSPC